MFQKMLDRQYRQPSGLIGRWIGQRMASQHIPENLWTVELLKPQKYDHILEIGFGPGVAIQALTQHVTEGWIAGIDFSQTMVRTAQKRNAAAVRQKRVDLRYGNASNIPFEDDTFNKAFSIHSIYFWNAPVDVLREIHRVLKSEGMLIMTVLPREKWIGSDPAQPIGTADCTPYSGTELSEMLTTVGFHEIRIEAEANSQNHSNYSVIANK